MKLRVASVIFALGIAVQAFSGSTGTTQLHTPQGSGSGTAFGDYVSDAAALNTQYHYFVEVPPGLSRLKIDIFDADLGLGGAAEANAGRDRDRNGFDSAVSYSVFNPNGASRTTLFTTGNTTTPAGSDNAWTALYDSTGDNVLDNFATAAYTNNDGSTTWATNWIETNDDNNAGAGLIQITGGQLRIRDDGNATNSTIEREANLTGWGTATLSFTLGTQNVEATDQVRVQVSNNGGGSWTTLETFTGAFAAGTTRSYDISAYIASNTRVRFQTVGTGYTGTDSFFVDAVQIKDSTIMAGHWEVRVDMSNAVTTGDDIGAIGLRASDGDTTSGGTELPMYVDSMLSIGANPPAAGTNSRSYSLYPYITSGCTCSQNDFDFDSNSGTVGSMVYTSRTGVFTQTVASAALSANDVWNRDTISGWTSDQSSTDYGIWSLAATINSYLVAGTPNGNYAVTYTGNYAAAANPPTSNPVTNAFRIYLPTDAGAAPVKPYVEQRLTQRFNGTLAVGTSGRYTVTVTVVNPTTRPIVFSAANLVTTNVPGSGAVYGGNAQTSQGTIVSTPAVSGTGNITWNPGTLASGATALLSYDVTVTPTSAGQRIPVTATPASGNGTRAKYVDETGNTTQARATFTFGPICELATTQGLLTEVLVKSFDVDPKGGRTTIAWETASEAGTIGFNLYRLDPATQTETRVNPRMIPAHVGAPQGGRYSFVDSSNNDAAPLYALEEVTASGRKNRYGPFVANGKAPVETFATYTAAARSEAVSDAATAKMPVTSQAAVKKNASAVMVGVRTTGLVQVAASDIAAQLSMPLPAVQAAIRNGNASVTSNGATIAAIGTPSGDSLVFFGEKPDTIFANERVYRITTNGGTQMRVKAAAGATGPVTAFKSTIDYETDAFAATVLPLDPDSNYWFWAAVIPGYPGEDRKQFSIDAPSMASSSNVTLKVRLQGAMADLAHHARVWLNGTPVGELQWKGLAPTNVDLNVPSGILRDGANQVEVEGLLDNGATLDVFYVDRFSLKYQRYAKPVGGAIEINADAGRAVTAGPFAGTPTAFDISDRTKPVIVTGATVANGMISFIAPSKSIYVTDTLTPPASIRGAGDAMLRGNNRADYVVIAPASIHTSADSLAALRQRDGLTTIVVDLEQIYDEFSGGNVNPHAIHDFIAATRSWQLAPKYFVLAGGGSLDYRSINVSAGLVPPIMTKTTSGLFAADALYADVNGDGVADVAIGRIPVSSASELDAYVAKLDASARANANASTIVFSADARDQGADFRRASGLVETPLASRPTTRVYLDETPNTAGRDAFIGAWRNGAPLVSWMGHGGLDRLSSQSILTVDDVPSLTSGGVLPFFVAMTCTINRFELGPSVDSLGAALTRTPNAGATAVFSASGLSSYSDATGIEQSLLALAAKTPTARIGDLVVQALQANKTSGETGSVYLLLGDPAIRLTLPPESVPAGGKPSLRGE